MKPIRLMDVVKYTYAIDYTAYDRTIEITNVEFDSRKVIPGTLFIPLKGTTDGHDYVQQAIENGAVATLWSNDPSLAPSDQIAVVEVDDTLIAFQKLAHYYRTLLNPIVIGITGSNGKTTTKDMTAASLSAKYIVHKTQGNYNNEIGLPYTLLKMPEETQVCVAEMGMSGFGEISELSRIAQPDIVAITLIGESHLEYLGSRAGIAKAKLEIIDGVKPNGILIYPGDEILISEQLDTLTKDKSLKTISFGLCSNYDVYAEELVEEVNRTTFKTNLDANITSMIPVIGAYNVSNALIALTIAQQLGVPIEQAIFQLSQFELTASRLEWLSMPNGAAVLNDAYNASPTSMKAVLQTFSNVEINEDGRKIVVLGDIRELGEQSQQLHESIQEVLDPRKIDKVYLFGNEMQALYRVLQTQYDSENLIYESSSHQYLVEQLQKDIQCDDMVLIKSSLGVDLLQVVTGLTGHPTHNMLRKH